jgi:hypothetical protein
LLTIYNKSIPYLVLSAIDRFVVEVKWDIEKDEIIGKAAFKYGQALDKYSNVSKEF